MRKFLQENKRRIFLSFIDKATEGTCEGGEIFLNIDLLIAATFIHEFLHAENPDMPERNVEILTEKILAGLSNKECQKIGWQIIRSARRKKYPN